MESMVEKGIDNAPSAGLSGAFYPRMFCATEEEWARARKEAEDQAGVSVDCAELYREANELPDDGNYGPTGAVLSLEVEEGFEYLYYIDGRGDWNSVAFRVAKEA